MRRQEEEEGEQTMDEDARPPDERRRAGRLRVTVLVVLGVLAAGLAGRAVRSDATDPGMLVVERATAPPVPEEPTPSPRPSRSPRPPRSPRPSPSPVPEVGVWEELPAAPGPARAEAAAAWTGTEVIVWGGSTGDGGGRWGSLADGAAYDPASASWRTLAPGPLGARAGAASAWTGTHLFVWGGVDPVRHLADGALYDPATDAWLPVPPGPLSPRNGARAVWTGREVVVIGGQDNAGAQPDSAAFDPAAGTWRRVPPLPGEAAADGFGTSVVWTGDRLVVLSVALPGPGHPLGDATLWTASAALNGWTSLALPGDGATGGVLAAADGVLAAIFQDEQGRSTGELHVLEPGAETWTVAADGPLLLDPYRHDLVMTEAGVLVVGLDPGSAAARYDRGTDRWARVTAAPYRPAPADYVRGGERVWTGEELLLLGGEHGETGGGLRLRLEPVPVPVPG